MKLSTMTLLAFQLNGALGTGKYDHITIEMTKDKIRDRTIFSYLLSQLEYLDISLFSEDEKKELLDEWEDLADAVDEDRKMCVERNGLCLLVAYLLEGIQRRFR